MRVFATLVCLSNILPKDRHWNDFIDLIEALFDKCSNNVTEADAVMGEEIFGPIMPILTFDHFGSMLADLKDKDRPLALYLLSSNKSILSVLQPSFLIMTW